MSRWHFLSLSIFTFAIAVTTGFVLIDGKDPEPDVDTTPAAVITHPLAGATQTPAAPRLAQLGLYVDLPDDLAARAHEEAQALAGEMGVLLVSSGTSDNASIVVTGPGGDGPAEVPVVDRWVAVTSMWSQQDKVALSPEMALPLLLPSESRDVLEPLLGDIALAPSVRWLPLAGIVGAVASDITTVALMPINTAQTHGGLRSLTIAGDGGRWLGLEDKPWIEERLVVRWAREDLHDFAVRLAERIETPAPPLTTVAFTGDMMPGRCVYERQRNLGDYTAAFAFVRDYLSAADITVGSLDASISDAGAPFPCEPTFNLLGPPESVDGLVAAGFDVITVATNHAKDCGSAGFGCSESIRDTLAYLRGAGIEPVGGGENLAEARRPVVIERNGVRFAFLGYDDIAPTFYGATETIPGTAPLSEESLREDIAVAKTMADVVIVLPQWGVEYTPYPSDRQVYLGRVALEAGATLVIGNHPHVVQGVEPGPGTFIAFALGNFVFDQDWSIETLQGAVLEATFAGDRLLGVSLKPQRIVNMFQPSFVEPDEARVILDRMRDASEYVAGR